MDQTRLLSWIHFNSRSLGYNIVSDLRSDTILYQIHHRKRVSCRRSAYLDQPFILLLSSHKNHKSQKPNPNIIAIITIAIIIRPLTIMARNPCQLRNSLLMPSKTIPPTAMHEFAKLAAWCHYLTSDGASCQTPNPNPLPAHTLTSTLQIILSLQEINRALSSHHQQCPSI